MSDPFQVRQGVRQDGILSTVHYKLFNNDLLHMLQDSGLGASIGCFYCGAPTCADDVAALGGRMHAQCIVYMVKGYCCGHRYCIHPKKSEEVPLNKDDKESQSNIVFGDEAIPKVQSTVHLGIHRQTNGRPDITHKVQLGWKAHNVQYDGSRCLRWFWPESCGICPSMEDLCDPSRHIRT